MIVVDLLLTATIAGLTLLAIFLYIAYDKDDYNNPDGNMV